MKQKKIQGILFLAIVLIIYGALLIVYPDKTIIAFKRSAGILLHILPIILLVILLSGITNFVFKPEKVKKHLGNKSGIKGFIIVLLAGLVSHGPVYIWFNLLKDLKSKGMDSGLIALFMYSRSVKIILLPLMIQYFGLLFTGILNFYLIAASIAIGLFMKSKRTKYAE